MKNMIRTLMLGIMLVTLLTGCRDHSTGDSTLFSDLPDSRSKILFDFGWKFHRGDMTGAESTDFDDASWRVVDLPHDWSIEDLPGTESPLDSTAVGGIDMGYFQGGTGWYRKTFHLPSELDSKKIFLLFEGVYMDSRVWINGELLGRHPYGYTSFWFDISEKLKYGDTNVLAVQVRNEGRNTRWYSGSGIYRHVWFILTEPVHVTTWGTRIVTPVVTDKQATVVISNEIENQSGENVPIIISTRIIDREGNQVTDSRNEVESGVNSTLVVTQEMEIASPDLWSTDSPSIYQAITEIRNDRSELVDRVESTFGIRSIQFSTEGFFLNGKPVLLKGGCVHHDNGPLGAAAFDRAEERRVELMKASGFNSIRCAHNPPSPAFLDACDRMGIMVIDEAFDMWRRQKNPQDYHRFFDDWWRSDIESMVLRDRNHPAVIMWSSGNEIPERAEPEGVETSRMLAEYIRQLDPARPVTSAVNGLNPDKDPFFGTVDIAGYNYAFGGDHGRRSIFETDHERVPARIMYSSESYPLTAFGAWMDVLDHPYVVGDFVWTGFDYLGEASIGWLGYPHEGSFYPWNHAYCGDLDILGMKRPQSFYRDVLWNNSEQLSLFVYPPEPSFEKNPGRMDWSKWHWQDVVDCWNWPDAEGKTLQVEVYSAYDTVELWLNGESWGSRETNRNTQWIARWEVPYSPGILKAVAYEGSAPAQQVELQTADDPVAIRVTADHSELKADGQDLSYILVELVDNKGHRNRLAENRVDFAVDGPGTLIAVASSNPMSSESYQRPHRNAYRGRCMAVIRSTRQPGTITLRASSDGLRSGEVVLTAN